jgi:hypothetical protein
MMPYFSDRSCHISAIGWHISAIGWHAFRHNSCCIPGMWIISFHLGTANWPGGVFNVDAIVDDFGNLVRAPFGRRV